MVLIESNLTAWQHLMNGSLIKAAYQAYNIPFSISGIQDYPLGILFIIFMIVLYIQSRNITLHFIVSLILFAIFFTWIPAIIKGVIIVILVLELAGIIYAWIVRD